MMITCPYCKKEFESKEILDSQLANEIRRDIERQLQQKLDAELQASEMKYAEKLSAELLTQSKKAETEKEISNKLRMQIDSLLEEMKGMRIKHDSFAQEADKRLVEEREEIRKQEATKAEERHHLEKKQLEEKLRQTRLSLDDAKARASQGSGQQKGEALELDLESRLSSAFPNDEIAEVKKGKSGADIVHTIKNQQGVVCGTILYECKNAKWQAAWIDKLKSDVRNASANIGVLVATNLNPNFEDVQQIESHIWATVPSRTILLAMIMRNQLIAVHTAHRNNELKDEKMEYLHRFIIGPEFRSRVEGMIQGYNKLQAELEKEKRAAKSRWAQQEQAIRLMIDSTYGMFGDFQGLLGGELKELPDSLSGGDGRSLKEIIVEDLLEIADT